LKDRTKKFQALKLEQFQAPNKTREKTLNEFATFRRAMVGENAKHTANALLKILALDKARKSDAASDPQILDEIRKDRNGFVIRFGEGAKYKIPELAGSPLSACWLSFIEAVKSQLELINSDQRSDQLRDAWNAGLDDYLAALDRKSEKDLVDVKGGVTKFLQFNGEKLPPDLGPEIKAQEKEIKAQEKARNP
jgi:hypothetical protein